MVQDQLVDYISSQVKLGVSRDAIKAALVSAGWVAADVDDTFKKVDGGASAVAAAGGAMGTVSAMKPATTGPTMSSSPAKGSEPQMIRVTDLISSSPSTVSASPVATAKPVSKDFMKSDGSQFGGKISGNTFQASSAVKTTGTVAAAAGPTVMVGKGGGSKLGMIWMIVAAVLILGFAGLAGYFYMANAGLATQVASLNGTSATVNTQLASLKSQLDASSTELAAQMASVTAANEDLALNLSFYAAPVGDASATAGTVLPVTISGWLTAAKGIYALTTPRGAKIFVANSANANVVGELKPLVGDTVQLVGTYVPGSDQMTVNSATSITSPDTSATPTASSTMMAATSSTQ